MLRIICRSAWGGGDGETHNFWDTWTDTRTDGRTEVRMAGSSQPQNFFAAGCLFADFVINDQCHFLSCYKNFTTFFMLIICV